MGKTGQLSVMDDHYFASTPTARWKCANGTGSELTGEERDAVCSDAVARTVMAI